MPEGRIRSVLLLVAAAVLFSTGGAVIKATALSNWQVAGFRSGIAALALLLLPQARCGWTWRLLPVGACYAAMLILFVSANKLTTAANATFLQATAPLYLLVISPVWLKERIRKSDVVRIAVLAIGMSLFFLIREDASASAPDPLRGNVLAALSGVMWAVTLASMRWLSRDRESGSVSSVVAGNLMAFAACLPMALPLADVTLRDTLAIGYLGIFQIGVAYVCLDAGVRRVPAMEASLILLAEPALNPVWAWLAHGERPAPLAIAGGVLILGAAFAGARSKR